MDGRGARVSACKALLTINRCELVYTTIRLGGKEITPEEVGFTLMNTDANKDITDAAFVRSINKAFDHIYRYAAKEEDLSFITEVYKIMLNLDMSVDEVDVIDKEAVMAELVQIHQMQPSFSKVSVLFCYLIQRKIFPTHNEELAYIMANKVLVRYGAGILRNSSRCDSFRLCVDRFKRSGDAVEMCRFLMHEYWNKIIV